MRYVNSYFDSIIIIICYIYLVRYRYVDALRQFLF